MGPLQALSEQMDLISTRTSSPSASFRRNPSGETKTDGVFKFFPLLSTEIRCIVWGMVANMSRLVIIAVHDRDEEYIARIGNMRSLYKCHNSIHPLLLVNKEANVELSKTKRTNISKIEGLPLWINPDIDVVFAQSMDFDKTSSIIRSRLPAAWLPLWNLILMLGMAIKTADIRHLMISYDHINFPPLAGAEILEHKGREELAYLVVDHLRLHTITLNMNHQYEWRMARCSANGSAIMGLEERTCANERKILLDRHNLAVMVRMFVNRRRMDDNWTWEPPKMRFVKYAEDKEWSPVAESIRRSK